MLRRATVAIAFAASLSAQNLIPNGDFETGKLTGWRAFHASIKITLLTNDRCGVADDKGLQLVFPAASKPLFVAGPRFTLSHRQWVDFSCYVRIPTAPRHGQFRCGIRAINSSRGPGLSFPRASSGRHLAGANGGGNLTANTYETYVELDANTTGPTTIVVDDLFARVVKDFPTSAVTENSGGQSYDLWARDNVIKAQSFYSMFASPRRLGAGVSIPGFRGKLWLHPSSLILLGTIVSDRGGRIATLPSRVFPPSVIYLQSAKLFDWSLGERLGVRLR